MELLEKRILLKSPAVDIEKGIYNSSQFIYFTFKGNFNREASRVAIEAWVKEFETNQRGTYQMVWDCMEMKDFDIRAKNDWMEALAANSIRVDTIFIVSDSILIRGAARLMAKFSKLNIQVCKSYEELTNTPVELVG